ncbi:unnamed protein product [Allacma fusca]|uniref:Chloride channel protein n=1 Tax=Allacma fusca TaxID=39272 RepID=A0A8J2KFX1_9HEXA|nr:unnamed protein product [Allacma fusca]
MNASKGEVLTLIEDKHPKPGLGKDEQLGYQHTLMYGRYTQDLSTAAKEEAKRLKALEAYDRKRRREEYYSRKKDIKPRWKALEPISDGFAFVWSKTVSRLGEDWVYLAMLGVVMAIISFVMDTGIGTCNKARTWLFFDLNQHVALQYFAWTILPICLVLFSAGFTHVVAPQAIGSGIPEMKTVLRGVILKDYLSFRTLFAKVVGLTASLGSGMPLGKEGPFVHIGSMVATILARTRMFQSIYLNQSRGMEMLAAACAVGVACCFAAPVGGVLMSIEVTSVYFAVRNYWRGFFAAACGALFFRLLAVWFQGHETLKPVFKTYLGSEFPYDPLELVVFAVIGAISGLVGAGFVLCHRRYVLWMRGNKQLNAFLQKNRFIYPFFVTWFIASINFPFGLGQFIAGALTTHDQVVTLFSNFSWTKSNFTVEEVTVVKHWINPFTGIFVNIPLYMLATFFLSILASTLPVPCGNFVPVFKLGAGLGRLVGEAMYYWFPGGINYYGDRWPIVPGGYALVGAAAVSGAVTRTISICVIVSEMTGQITYIIPVMIAVLISNAVAGLLQPSLFDSIALIKKLPYLPDFIPSAAEEAYNVLVKDFMVPNVKYIWYGMSYNELKNILGDSPTLTAFPVVDNRTNRILLGSIERPHLIKSIERHIGRERRIKAAATWHRENMKIALMKQENELRRPSRFEVIPVPSITLSPTIDDNDAMNRVTIHGATPFLSPLRLHLPPKKSILKKTSSFSFHKHGQGPSKLRSPYQTVTGAESGIAKAFHNIFTKSSALRDANEEIGAEDLSLPTTPTVKKTVQLPRERVIDMSPEEQEAWEEEEMQKRVDLSRCTVEPSPIQLVSKTMLLKVHSLFSLLQINRAYVTSTGRLIGVVSMKELRSVIEQCNSGSFKPIVPEEKNSSVEDLLTPLTDDYDSRDELDDDDEDDCIP